MQTEISCSWVNLIEISARHDNNNCDLTIQAVATFWVVDVAHKLRKRYSSISQILRSRDSVFGPMAGR